MFFSILTATLQGCGLFLLIDVAGLWFHFQRGSGVRIKLTTAHLHACLMTCHAWPEWVHYNGRYVDRVNVVTALPLDMLVDDVRKGHCGFYEEMLHESKLATCKSW